MTRLLDGALTQEAIKKQAQIELNADGVMRLNENELSYRWRKRAFRNIDNAFHKFKLVIAPASG